MSKKPKSGKRKADKPKEVLVIVGSYDGFDNHGPEGYAIYLTGVSGVKPWEFYNKRIVIQIVEPIAPTPLEARKPRGIHP